MKSELHEIVDFILNSAGHYALQDQSQEMFKLKFEENLSSREYVIIF